MTHFITKKEYSLHLLRCVRVYSKSSDKFIYVACQKISCWFKGPLVYSNDRSLWIFNILHESPGETAGMVTEQEVMNGILLFMSSVPFIWVKNCHIRDLVSSSEDLHIVVTDRWDLLLGSSHLISLWLWFEPDNGVFEWKWSLNANTLCWKCIFDRLYT